MHEADSLNTFYERTNARALTQSRDWTVGGWMRMGFPEVSDERAKLPSLNQNLTFCAKPEPCTPKDDTALILGFACTMGACVTSKTMQYFPDSQWFLVCIDRIYYKGPRHSKQGVNID
jgi:hypothetical protein